MIIKQLAVPKSGDHSFQVRQDLYPRHQSIWHYHNEIELIHVIRGSGTVFIGDRIKGFQAGNTVMIPSHVPHYWLFDEDLPGEEDPIDCIVIHFLKDFGSSNFLKAPELSGVRTLLDRSTRGMFIEEAERLTERFKAVLSNTGLEKLFSLFSLLQRLPAEEPSYLISENYAILNQSDDQARMNNLMSYIRENYKHKIKLLDLAKVADMTENSFCRYFKQRTGKTPVQFINELRIAHACFQLRNKQMPLKEICYDSGFNNFVSFHKTFKSITGTTPTQFRE